jgi:hypothetical protein
MIGGSIMPGRPRRRIHAIATPSPTSSRWDAQPRAPAFAGWTGSGKIGVHGQIGPLSTVTIVAKLAIKGAHTIRSARPIRKLAAPTGKPHVPCTWGPLRRWSPGWQEHCAAR